ncbi:unnamed protein product [Auanema sp. JU1783]|nr:unnamed protein product [Auanema sp. JU1783]
MNEIHLATNSISSKATSDTEDEIFIIDEGVGLTPHTFEYKPQLASSPEKKGRGRPKKLTQTFFFDRPVTSSFPKNGESVLRKRGRPRKENPIPTNSAIPLLVASSPSLSDDGAENTSDESSDTSYTPTNNTLVATIPKRRGRPPKRTHIEDLNEPEDHSVPAKKNPQVLADVLNVTTDGHDSSVKKKRGRPKKILNNNSKLVVTLGKKKGKRGRPRLHDLARPVTKHQRSSERVRRSARVLSPEFNSPHILKPKTTMVLPLDIPVSQIDPNFSKEEALSDLTALYNTVPDGMTYLFHAQVKGFIITLKEIMPNFNRDSSPRI